MAGDSVNVRCLMKHPLMQIFQKDERRATHSGKWPPGGAAIGAPILVGTGAQPTDTRCTKSAIGTEIAHRDFNGNGGDIDYVHGAATFFLEADS